MNRIFNKVLHLLRSSDLNNRCIIFQHTGNIYFIENIQKFHSITNKLSAMRNHLIHFVFLGLIFISAKSPEINPVIQNIWVGDHVITLYFDSTECLFNDLPMIMDLSDKDQAVIKYFGGNELKASWSLNNQILTINNVDYRIISLSDDSIVYSPYLVENPKPETKANEEDELYVVPVRDEYYVFKRPKEFKPERTVEEITNYFNNSLFYSRDYDPALLKVGDYLDFLDNGVVIYKSHYDGTSNILLHEDCWRIENYKGYSFLYFFHNIYSGNGLFDHAHQILGLDDTGFTISGFPRNKQTDFIPARAVKADNIQSKMAGKWISENDSSKFYSDQPLKEMIKSGRYQLYTDTLIYNFNQNSLTISGNGFLPVQCNWRINSDNSILIYEYTVETDDGNAIRVGFASILSFNDDSLELELFGNYLPTGFNKPEIFLLNRIQSFRKID